MARRGHRVHAAPVAAGVIAVALAVSAAGEPKPTAPQVKAAMVLNFLKFVEWPPESPAGRASSIVVCVWGDDPITEAIGQVGKKASTPKPVTIHEADELKDLDGCHVVVLTAARAADAPEAIERLGARPVLLIGDADGLAERGAAVGFYMEHAQVRFEVNPEAVKAAGLTLSSRLLRLARIVAPRGDGGGGR